MMKRQREDVLVRRAVRVERIPDGSPIDLEAGILAQITQALGSSFTLLVEGQLVRLRSVDADAIGKGTRSTGSAPDGGGRGCERPRVAGAAHLLRPEIPVNIVELGLIYRCVLEPLEGDTKVRVVIDMTLTAPAAAWAKPLPTRCATKCWHCRGWARSRSTWFSIRRGTAR